MPELEGAGLPPANAPPRRHEVDQEGLVSGEVGASHARRGGNLMLGFPLNSFGELRLRLFFVMTGLTLVHGAIQRVLSQEHLKLCIGEGITAIRANPALHGGIFHSLI